MKKPKVQKIKTPSGHTMIATPYTPPQKPAKPKKALDPEMAWRKINALNQFLEDGDITMAQFGEMKQRVLDQMLGGKQ